MSKRGVQPSPAGWYDDPYIPGQLRYFDGTTWTDGTESGTPDRVVTARALAADVSDVDLPPAPSTPRPRWLRLLFVLGQLAVLVAAENFAFLLPGWPVGVLVALVEQVAVAVVVAPLISFSRSYACTVLIPLYNVYVLCRFAWRLAYLPYRDWEPRPDEADAWRRYRHPTRPGELLYRRIA